MESCQTHRDGKATAAARREAARAHCRRATCRAAQSTTRAVILSCSVRLLYFRLLSNFEHEALFGAAASFQRRAKRTGAKRRAQLCVSQRDQAVPNSAVAWIVAACSVFPQRKCADARS